MTEPLFSVLVPTFNQSAYLGAALDSLLAQTDPGWEAVVVNDGSTDATKDVMELYAKRDGRIRAFHKENGGVGSALNVGLKNARGSWVCWLSSDDFFEPEKLALHREAIDYNPQCRFFFTHFRYLNETSGETTEPPLWRELPPKEWQVIEMLRGTYIHGNSICVARTSWNDIGGFDERLRYGQDYDMWLRLASHFPAVFLPERTCVTRWHAHQTTNLAPRAGFFDGARAAMSFLNTNSFPRLFPMLDLESPATAFAALTQALLVAEAGNDSVLYSLGPHMGLLRRIVEWAWVFPIEKVGAKLRRSVRKWAIRCARNHRESYFGFLCDITATLAKSQIAGRSYEPVSARAIAQRRVNELAGGANLEAADEIQRYLERYLPGEA